MKHTTRTSHRKHCRQHNFKRYIDETFIKKKKYIYIDETHILNIKWLHLIKQSTLRKLKR